MNYQNTIEFAAHLDETDPLKAFQSKFLIPSTTEGMPSIFAAIRLVFNR